MFLNRYIILFLVFGLIFFFGAATFVLHNQIVDFSSLENYNPGNPSILLDDEGNEWARFQIDRRQFVQLDVMSKHIVNAFISAEDHAFFKHQGISFRGILRSIIVNIWRGRRAQGASTITQQLIRLLFFDAKKTFARKVKEQIISILVERQFTKEYILETYLNHVYFGYGIYGVEAASQRFWGKSACDVSIDEAAILASIVRSPQHYSPLHAPESVGKRRDVILRSMFRLDCINQEEYDSALNAQVVIKQDDDAVFAPHLKETIRIEVEKIIGKKSLYTGGFVIQTTINRNMQKAAQESFTDHVSLLRKTMFDTIDGGMVCIESKTGEVKSFVGGYDFKTSKFNRVLQAKRQMGSTFKPLVYAVALEQGLSLLDVEVDEPYEYFQNGTFWAPRNHTRTFVGPMTLARALSFSNNVVTIKTALKSGLQNIVEMSRRSGISAALQPYPSLALGCVNANLLESVAAFNLFANHGKYVEPHYLRWVKNKSGEKIYKAKVEKKQVLSWKIASQIGQVLTFSIRRLQAAIGDRWFGGEALGKTGTTNDSRTCWFCGSTPDYTTSVYIGSDDNCTLGEEVYASKVAFPVWFYFHQKCALPPGNFVYDPLLKPMLVNWKTGNIVQGKNNLDEKVVSLLI